MIHKSERVTFWRMFHNNKKLSFTQALLEYILYPAFSSEITNPTNAYQRPINTQKLSYIDFSSPVTSAEIRSEKNRLIRQLLFTTY